MSDSYLDWFFLHYYGKEREYWMGLTEEKIQALIQFETEKENRYWKTWTDIFKSMMGSK